MAKLTALLALNTAHFQAGLKNAAREICSFKKNIDGASGIGKGFAEIGTSLGASIAAGDRRSLLGLDEVKGSGMSIT